MARQPGWVPADGSSPTFWNADNQKLLANMESSSVMTGGGFDMSLEIEIQGVVPEKVCVARREIQTYLGRVGKILGDTPLKVHVTSDFDQTVNRILREKRLVKIPYSSKRISVAACAKTICYPHGDGIGFILVLNSGVLGKWEDEWRAYRILVFCHEAAHITDALKLFNFLGAEPLFSEPTKTVEIMSSLARGIWGEYMAERFAVETMQEVARNVSSGAAVQYNIRDWFVDSFIELLNTLPQVLRKDTSKFRLWMISMDDLWPKVYLGLREMLVVASLVAAYSDALSKKDDQIEKMKNFAKHCIFFQKWEAIHKELRLLYEYGKLLYTTDDYDIYTQHLTRISNELLSIFRIYGFAISDVESGIYVSVEETC